MVPGNEKNHKGMPSLNANAVFELLCFLRQKIVSWGYTPLVGLKGSPTNALGV